MPKGHKKAQSGQSQHPYPVTDPEEAMNAMMKAKKPRKTSKPKKR